MADFDELNNHLHLRFETEILLGKLFKKIIKDEVLLTVGCPIFPPILIAKYLFTGSLKK
jgi:hypothetical protein